MFKSFLLEKTGNFAIIGGIVMLPLLTSVGFVVDYTRYLSAESHLQELADVASLALAGTREEDEEKLETMAREFLAANLDGNKFSAVEIVDLNTDNSQIDLSLKSTINTHFMGLANIDRLDVRASALAERAVTGSVEIAMVLDNTYSMAELNSSGVTKLAALKEAANALVTQLMLNSDASSDEMSSSAGSMTRNRQRRVSVVLSGPVTNFGREGSDLAVGRAVSMARTRCRAHGNRQS